jgi:hypothetical protein
MGHIVGWYVTPLATAASHATARSRWTTAWKTHSSELQACPRWTPGPDGGLGARMVAAAEAGFGALRVIIVGTDCPP